MFEDVKEKLLKENLSRQEANDKIMKLLGEYLTSNPDIRFGQALRNLGFVRENRDENGMPVAWHNEFNTESLDSWKLSQLLVLERAEATLKTEK